MRRLVVLSLALIGLAAGARAAPTGGGASLVVDHSIFQLRAGGKVLTSRDLVGATLETTGEDGLPATIRIDAVSPAPERPAVLLHDFTTIDAATGKTAPLCEADVKGRQVGFPVAGRWDAKGRLVKDPKVWFPVCTSGAQGKCILWGYDPWSRGPHGEDLAPLYEACIHMVRADYDGRGAPFTRDGTEIDVWDLAGIQTPDTLNDPRFAFEAGWAPKGAVCVARTRYADLLPRSILLQSAPRLGGPCDEESARRRGAVLFNRSR